ncbi:MAG TPA: hypothetical protein VE421_05910 [Burkholderiaceae bacterium]|nr:hypothetical protein [Burkholderiaceae bacterium]
MGYPIARRDHQIKPTAERLEWLTWRALELKQAMGSRYLCHEKNRVRRLDGRSYQAHQQAS